jgi:broad specificity phosphatase PhoE
MKIVLLRHGKPRLPSFGKMTGSEFSNWISSYNAAPLDIECLPPSESINISERCNTAICSTLVRSMESSERLGLNTKVEVSSDFIEAALPSYNIFNLRFSEKFWLVTFRVSWFIGYSPNTESYSEAKLRAKKCSDKLVETARGNESVIFVGHGILNRLISKELKSCGWQGPVKTNSKYWQFAIYENET